ncbi:MAG: ACP S-malonyltransferase [Planctomycetes bacterium]|nr:ACP S-malonyltransferase [Planctomycetota bacterium]
MAKTAILFTGQGAQSVGMGRDIAEASPAAAAVFEQANEVVGYDLRGVCFGGPAERLEQTDVQQPAIFTTSVAIWQALQERAVLPEPVAAMAGLSLGEYTALFAAASLSFEDALRLVKRRGELMQAAATAVPSGMVSAIGLDPGKVEAICSQASDVGVIQPANFNSPGQIVLSGARAACEKAAVLIEQAGGRAIPLKVAGAFHSPLMKPAADGLAEMLAVTPFTAPRVPVIANVNCRPHGDAAAIRHRLTEQLTQPVRWQESMETLLAEGVEQFIEVGPGRVLTGLMKKISRRTSIINISSAADLALAAA